ncbi:MAG: hypothetical protein HYT94_04220 [Parcubacteria group bacterium]|nr:hypothetical protein [Parcubacteria group bacterium]
MNKNPYNIRICFLFLSLVMGFFFLWRVVLASSLTVVRDTISTSIPSASATHEIMFTVTNALPPSGKIIITPEDGAFIIPAAFNFLDADLAVAASGSYIDRPLAASPSAVNDGLSVVSGASGSLSFTLNSTTGINAGEKVQIELGNNAAYAATGTNFMVNPAPVGSYRIRIRTDDASGVPIDSGTAMIAIIAPVTGGPVDTSNTNPPALSNGLPSGLLPSGTQAVELSVLTDVSATCKYSTLPDIPFASSTGAFPLTGGTTHSGAVVTGLLDGLSYSYYVRCQNYQLIANSTDYVLSFSVGIVPSTEPPPPPASSGGGSGPLGGGNFLKTADVSLSGTAYPSAKIFVLKDGKEAAAVTAAADGKWGAKVLGLDRGTYTFGVYAIDAKSKKSSIISSTVSVIAGTGNTVARILLPPTLGAAKTSADPGQDFVLSGYGIPKSITEVSLSKQNGADGDSSAATTTVLSNGEWTLNMSTKGLSVGGYEARARSLLFAGDTSGFGAALSLGIGQDAAPDPAVRSDMNGDGKINLIDFSILLFSWGKSNPAVDLNGNGKVDLADFSILIFYWTA